MNMKKLLKPFVIIAMSIGLSGNALASWTDQGIIDSTTVTWVKEQNTFRTDVNGGRTFGTQIQYTDDTIKPSILFHTGRNCSTKSKPEIENIAVHDISVDANVTCFKSGVLKYELRDKHVEDILLSDIFNKDIYKVWIRGQQVVIVTKGIESKLKPVMMNYTRPQLVLSDDDQKRADKLAKKKELEKDDWYVLSNGVIASVKRANGGTWVQLVIQDDKKSAGVLVSHTFNQLCNEYNTFEDAVLNINGQKVLFKQSCSFGNILMTPKSSRGVQFLFDIIEHGKPVTLNNLYTWKTEIVRSLINKNDII